MNTVLKKHHWKHIIIGLLIGVFLGTTGTYTNLQPRITHSENKINTIKLELQDLISKVEYYEIELLDAKNNITKYASHVSYLESQISVILNNSRINYGDISVEQAKYIISSKPYLIILDVRTEEEYNNSHIEGSINIPLNMLDQKIIEFCPCKEFLLYCRSGVRSRQAMDILLEKGYVMAYNMIGGIDAWNESLLNVRRTES